MRNPRTKHLSHSAIRRVPKPRARASRKIDAKPAAELNSRQSALHDQLLFVQRLIDTIPAPIFYKDERARYLGANKAFERFIGLTREQLIGKSVYDIAPKDLADVYHAADKALFDEPGAQIYEASVKDAEGKRRDVIFHKGTFTKSNGSLGGLVGAILDVSERKRVERALHDSEKRFRKVFDDAAVGLALHDPDRAILRVNSALCHVLGYSLDELRGKTYREVTHPDDMEVAVREVKRVTAGEVSSVQVEHRYLRKDGRPIWALTTVSAIRDDSGQLLYFLSEIQDITGHKEILQQLSRIAAIVQSSGDAILSVTVDRTITSWNRGAEELFGYSAAEAIGRHGGDLMIPPHRDEETRAVVAQVLRGETIRQMETERRRKDGTVFPVSLTASPIIDDKGQIVGIASIVRNITVRKRMEGALRESEQRFRDFAETASDWFWETGPDHRFSFTSAQTGRFGYDSRIPIGQRRWDYAVDTTDEPDKWREHKSLLDRHAPFREFVYRIHDDKGVIRYVSTSGKPMFDEHGVFLGYRGSSREVTEAVLANAALIAAKNQAEIANQSKSNFLANMSHELRTPLNAIIGFAEIMKSGVFGTAPNDRYAAYAADIHKSALHLLDIISDILDVARIESGKVELKKQPLALQGIMREVAHMMSEQAEHSGLELVLEAPPDVPKVSADVRSIRQILLNLVSNALKFTGEGGRVTLGLRRGPEGVVQLFVADTGIGIAAKDMALLMRPFAQVDNAYNRKRPGTGLGLALVRSLAELHGGTVSIASEPERGTTVTVSLPATSVLDEESLRDAVGSA
jgi:PAS domain S-box-containing protein